MGGGLGRGPGEGAWGGGPRYHTGEDVITAVSVTQQTIHQSDHSPLKGVFIQVDMLATGSVL